MSSAQLDTIHNALSEIIELRERIGIFPIPPDSLCFVEQGNAVVYNKDAGGIVLSIGPGTFFGESHLTRKVSH